MILTSKDEPLIIEEYMSQIISHQMKAHGLCASVTNYGASLQDLRLTTYDIPLVLGFSAANDYASHNAHMGATAGRYANRIAGGAVTIDGQDYQLDRNEGGKHTLHGGEKGCGTALWELIEADESHVLFGLEERDGHMGFPGAVSYLCRYEITANATLAISYEARTTAPTIINLAHHSYFRLDTQEDISGHELQILSDHYLPVDAQNLPDGRIIPVANTRFDFTKRIAIGQREFDHNFCLTPTKEIRQIARLYSPHSGIEMVLCSDQPGLQFYTSHHLDESAPNHHGRAYGAFDGVCLEPQNWPNSPNMADAPSSYLGPDETYRQKLTLQFAHKGASS